MDTQNKIIEIKTKLRRVDESSSSPYYFQENKYDQYLLNDGRRVSAQKSRSIFYGRGIAFREYRSDIDHLDEKKEVTVKIRIRGYKFPKWIPEAARNFLEEITEKISLVPYWHCDCMSLMLATNIVYTKEQMEKAISAKKELIENTKKYVRSGEAIFVGYGQRSFSDKEQDFFCNSRVTPCMCSYGTRMYLASDGELVNGFFSDDIYMDKDVLREAKMRMEMIKA